ncbi:hypothetical protein SAMN05444266_101646 [Chitinophaga jiangningensis]|uniref:Uncharacterized protein n=1 Tax=Chitinophaga jiangningensis TaxID=1419482 RepID=A0A1M6WJ99_9BACT|nr:hypothetical protein [Chitinophaga jiangningensis]SHK93679.1 hypothetical protein SAMN05444266_101646 [Chitinophaga jiangningensis]
MKSDKNQQGEVVISPTTGVAVASGNSHPVSVVEMSSIENMPDLDDAVVVPIDLMAEYWEPAAIGESKKVYFHSVAPQMFPDFNDPSVEVEIDCALFYEKTKGEVKPWRNASKRLVSLLNGLTQGSVVQITYLGKKKNKKNSFESAVWSIKPIVINLPKA